jgi:hypothetical protein
MWSSNLVRLGGVAAVVTGLTWVVLVLVSPHQEVGISFFSGPLASVMFFVALLGQLAALGGLHALQRERHGLLGATGSLIALLGFALQDILIVATSLLGDEFVSSPLGLIVFVVLVLVALLAPLVGLVLLGVAILRQRVLPGWFGVLLVVGLPVAVLLGVLLGPLAWWIAYGVFWVLIGYLLLSSRGTMITNQAVY